MKGYCPTLITIAALVAMSLLFSAFRPHPFDTTFVHYTDTIAANGTTLVYEVMGRGKPVILLHGNGGRHQDLDSAMNVLSRAGYRVYGIDSRGQGANPPVSEYHYTDMAEDVYQFIHRHGLQRPVIFGWSDGGNIALQLEVTHPGTCAALITSGANIFPEGWGGRKNIEDRKARDPHPQPLRRMLYYEPTMTFHDMTTIQCPVLICAGQYDVILPSHTRTIADSIPHGRLHIERGANHTSYVKHSTRIAHIILDYLHTIGY